MTPEGVVRELWSRIEQRDWVGLTELLDPDVRVEWPATGETFVGRQAFVSVQAEYPEGWTIQLLRVISAGDTVVSEVEVPHRPSGLTFRVASFLRVRGDHIVDATEYWITVGGDEPPEWRRRWNASQPPDAR